MELRDKVALVTGSAAGIGKAVAFAFARQGATVVLNDIYEERLLVAADELRTTGANVLSIVANTALRSDVDSMFRQIMQAFGRLDILINNAGITRDSFLHKMSDEQWQQVIDVNLTGVYYCLQAAARIMREAGAGRIVNVSSDSRFGNPGQANYAASKAGVVGLTRTAAKELARNNVLVNAVSPGSIETDMVRAMPEKALERIISMIPLGRMGTPDEVSQVILFLASEKNSYVTGQVINVDGGMFTA